MISTSTTAAEAQDKSNGDLAVCKLCRRQFAKYTCPSCNVPYCSLTCFRSESHGECSESFYRKEVETDIRSEPSKTAEERRRMMDLLKKFEEDSLKQDEDDGDGDDDEGEGSDDEPTALAKRLHGVDLDSTLPDDLWTLLTPSQQQKFMKALQDPQSELAQQLLTSEQIEKETLLPWWDGDDTDPELEHEGAEHDNEREHDENDSGDSRSYGKDPTPMPIPTSMVKPVEGGLPLIYNIVAVLIAYAYTTRYFASSLLSSISPNSPDFIEAQRTISRITPFLVERRATAVFGSVREVVTDVWARLGQENVNNGAMTVFLRDAAKLLRPLPVVALPPPPPRSASPLESPTAESTYNYGSHPHRRSVLALADLYHLYSATSSSPPPASIRASTRDHTKSSRTKPKSNPTTQKLVFYGARLLALPSHILSMVAEELLGYVELMKRESVSVVRDLRDLREGVQVNAAPSGTSGASGALGGSLALTRAMESKKPLVEEI